MFELKFEFLRAISEHEHFVALNMPLDIRGNLNSKFIYFEMIATSPFRIIILFKISPEVISFVI